VPKAPEYHERDDIRRLLSAIQNSAASLIKLFATGTAPEAPITLGRALRPIRHFCRVARHAPHFPDPPPGDGSWADRGLASQIVVARWITEPVRRQPDPMAGLPASPPLAARVSVADLSRRKLGFPTTIGISAHQRDLGG
jgi:hypothetical protein